MRQSWERYGKSSKQYFLSKYKTILFKIRFSKDILHHTARQTAQKGRGLRLFPASASGFSKYSGKGLRQGTQPPDIRHRGSNRAFRDVLSRNCCFLNGISRKSLFPTQVNCRKPLPFCAFCPPK